MGGPPAASEGVAEREAQGDGLVVRPHRALAGRHLDVGDRQDLRVYTVKGKALILHSPREAVDLLAEVPGMQVHRSHRVARDHLRRLRRRGRGTSRVRSSGLEVPVSRANQAAVRAAFGERASCRASAGED